MNESTKNSIISAVTSILMLAGSIPAFAKFLPPSTVSYLTNQLPGVLTAIGTLIGVGAFVYKLFPKSTASIVKGAAQLPEVTKIVTTPAIAAQMPDQKEVTA